MNDQEKLSIIADTWALKKTSHVPYIVETGKPHLATLDFYNNDAKELAWNENYHASQLQVNDYNIPNVKPNVGIGIVAAAFGCENVPNNDADPWIKPSINEETIRNVYLLKKPDIKTNKVYARAFDRLAYLQSHTNLPLRMLNIPSPLVVASQIWDYTSFVESTIAHPSEVHHLLGLVTTSIIEYVNEQLLKIRNLYTMGHEPFYIPKDIGLRISDDTAAVMSPNAFREFGLVYNTRIAEAFHGLIWHSCGDVSNVLSAVLETPGLRGVDIVLPQNSWNRIKEVIANRVAIIARHYFFDHPQKDVDPVEYSKRLLDYFGNRGILILTSVPTLSDSIVVAKGLRQFCEY